MEIVLSDNKTLVSHDEAQFENVIGGTTLIGHYIHVIDNAFCYATRDFLFEVVSGLHKVVHDQSELFKWDELNLIKDRPIWHFAIDPA